MKCIPIAVLAALLFSIFSCKKESLQPQLNSGDEEQAITADSVIYKNSFTQNAQGWTITGDAQGGSVVPTYHSTGGNPGGFIGATDNVAGGVWYFNAAAKFLDHMKTAYGNTLRFDLEQSDIISQFDAKDVIITGNGIEIFYNTASNPGTTWTKYRVPLKASEWIKTSTNVSPTRSEMKGILKNITQLWIRGEYISGPDTGGLDNPAIVVPLP